MTTIASLALLVGCGSDIPLVGSDSSSFADRARAAGKEGWTAYWLGESFTVDDATFEGPKVPEFGGVDEGGVSYHYVAPSDPVSVELSITLWSRTTWNDVKANLDFGGKPANIIGNDARTTAVLGPRGDIIQRRVLIETEDTIIDVTAWPGGPDASTGQDRNPLMAEGVLLATLENLRRYPE